MSIEFVAAAVSGPAVTAKAPTAAATSPADPDAVSRFSSAMAPDDPAPGEKVAPLSAVSPSDRPATLGDSILQRLNSIGEHYRKSSVELHQTIRKGFTELSGPALIGLQLQVAERSFNIELISKTVAKVTQHCDQLTKLQ